MEFSRFSRCLTCLETQISRISSVFIGSFSAQMNFETRDITLKIGWNVDSPVNKFISPDKNN